MFPIYHQQQNKWYPPKGVYFYLAISKLPSILVVANLLAKLWYKIMVIINYLLTKLWLCYYVQVNLVATAKIECSYKLRNGQVKTFGGTIYFAADGTFPMIRDA